MIMAFSWILYLILIGLIIGLTTFAVLHKKVRLVVCCQAKGTVRSVIASAMGHHTPPIDEVSSNLHPKKKKIKVPTQ